MNGARRVMIKILKKYFMKIMILGGVIFLIFTLLTGIQLETAAIPTLMSGNREVIDRIEQQDPNHFTFLVTADSKNGTATLESLLGIIEQEDPAFVVIVGDFASKPTLYAHRFFVMETSEYAIHVPLLVVPGNHDVGIDSPFTLNDYESLYGAPQKSFHIGNNLFILLNDVSSYNLEGQYIDFLEETIKSQAVPPSHIFVFMHVPPAGLNISLDCSTAVQSERFLDTVRKYHVDYVFCGHHHGYAKTNLDGVNFIIAGGGGQDLCKGQGRFHHAIRVTVNSNEISEAVIIIKRQMETVEFLEQQVATHIWPFFVNHRLSTAGIAIIAIYLFFVRNNKQKIFSFFKMKMR
jgi:Icc-related predicted phosphoesterase